MGVWSVIGGSAAAQLRLAIVGCGDIGGYTAWLARLNPGIRLAACCDVEEARARAFARRHKIPHVYQDYADMLSQVELDAVYLAVPHHLHHPMLADAITAGLPVFVEKPITRTLQEGIEITRLAAARGVKVGVNYQYRYDAGCYALARAVQRGDLGEIHYARINLPWHREAGYFEGAGWHKSLAQAGGGTLITQGSHLLDIVLWALGEPPRSAMGYISQRVFTTVEVEDLAQGTLEMAGGALVQVCSSMVAASEQAVSIEIYGRKGTAIYTNKPRPQARFVGLRLRKECPPGRGLHALQRSLEGFRAWVVAGQPYLTPAAEALPALAAVEALYRSARSGQREFVASSEN
jgi:predicted dehydrogenase